MLTLLPTMGAFIKNNRQIKPIRTGISVASTFAGFCALHDRELFSPIENSPFEPVPEHVFLVSYRGYCREHYNKVAHADLPDLIRQADAGRSLQMQGAIQNIANDHDLGIQAALRDGKVYKGLLDDMLMSQDYSGLSALVLVFEEAPPIMTSGGLLPTHDHKNNLLQDLLDLQTTPDILFVNSFSSNGRGYIVLSWFNKFETAPTRLLETLRQEPVEIFVSLVVQFMFKWLENLYMRESWWNGISDDLQQRFIRFFRESADPFIPARFDNFILPAPVAFPTIREIVQI